MTCLILWIPTGDVVADGLGPGAALHAAASSAVPSAAALADQFRAAMPGDASSVARCRPETRLSRCAPGCCIDVGPVFAAPTLCWI